MQVQEGQGELLPEYRRPSDPELQPAPRLQQQQLYETSAAIKTVKKVDCSDPSGFLL